MRLSTAFFTDLQLKPTLLNVTGEKQDPDELLDHLQGCDAQDMAKGARYDGD
jgi:hypothetical protein